jgi:hypothetical protein
MTQRIKLRSGLHAALPTSSMLEGEPLVTLDRGNLHVASDATTKIAITPAIDALTSIGAISSAADLLIIHDADSTGQREKKVTFAAFKAALNIPAASTDEKTAIVSGGTAGYLYGDGTDGVLRMGSSMSWTKDGSNAFATIDVSVIDCGGF